MKGLLSKINKLKNQNIKTQIDNRITEFQEFKNKSNEDIFKELCFCILTANFNAEKGIKIQKEIGDGFLNLPEKELAIKLKKLGYRFPNTRAKYIIEARNHIDSLKHTLNSFKDEELREYLIKNIKGISYKECSHFLRNIGYPNYAIIDFHIINLLKKHNLVEKPRTFNKDNYLKIESLLKRIANKSNLTLAELDLYLWHLETKKVLK